jgi:Tfp pilus assembly protein PilO
MTRIQQWLAGTAVAVLVIVAAGWFLAISPQKHKVSNLNAQSTAQDQTNSGLRTKLSVLTAQMQAVPTEQAEIAAITQKIPNDPAMPAYVRTLTAVAQQTGVELVSIAPGAPAAVSVAAAAVAAAPVASATASATASAVPAAPVVPAVSLQSISVALNVQGGYFQVQQFVAALQKLPRTTVVDSIALAPTAPLKKVTEPSAAPTAAAWKSLGAEITLNVFMNSSEPFATPSAPALPSGATVPGAAAASAAPALPSASASN